eukprot:TRINITY_DN14403_c0_g1_i1.p1 TRINITY_DN14403_c0_g1~~TRINITY_DN14403_c0_g1_i1.p1  ORF type:complete len:402 (-),score=58.95 TRINITY_DN14403_c0_g1_i1:157-1362(-)
MMIFKVTVLLLFGSYLELSAGEVATLESSTKSASLLIHEQQNVTFHLTYDEGADLPDQITLYFREDFSGIIQSIPNITIDKDSSAEIILKATKAGHVVVTAVPNHDNISFERTAYVRVDVMQSKAIDTFSTVVGWIYFVAWSVSFYPQIIENFRRKSVIGLNFDFLTLNIVGFTLYGLFNIGLFWIKPIQDEYFDNNPQGVNPVQANDVFFAIHAVFACIITIIQCKIYQRGSQRVSRICIGILIVIFLFLGISLICSLAGVLTWLNLLYFCSYVKLGITLIKYIPQAYMNYRRKSTVGWSIGNILLDFTGGALSILQMILISYNNNDWGSIFGDPTKFGLGFFSILFDVLFIVQHYCLYRGNLPHQELEGHNRKLSQDSYDENPGVSGQTSSQENVSPQP